MKKREIFEDIPDDIDETWHHGSLVGGMAIVTLDELAFSYKIAGDILIDNVIDKKSEAFELLYPIIFNYRHSIELYLKSLVVHQFGHDLLTLLDQLKADLSYKYNNGLPNWFEKFILEINDFDYGSTVFRYNDDEIKSFSTKDTGEFWVDYIHLKSKMDEIQKAFRRLILNEKSLHDSLIIKTRTIRPSTRKSPNYLYRINVERVQVTDLIEIHINHESTPYKVSYRIFGYQMNGKKNIYFKVKELNGSCAIEWQGEIHPSLI